MVLEVGETYKDVHNVLPNILILRSIIDLNIKTKVINLFKENMKVIL